MAVSVTVKTNAPSVSAFRSNSSKVLLSVKGIGINTQTKTVTPSDEAQIIEGDEGYYLASVTVEAIPSYYGHIAYNGGVLTVY